MITVVGESLIDVVPSPEGPHDHVGGGPLNIAVGCARLEESALLITQIGADERGDEIRRHLARNEVEVLAVPTRSGRTSTATARLDDQGRADYDFDLEWSLPGQELPACDALHVGSLGTVLEPGRDAVIDLVEQAWRRDVFCSFDPNLRPQFLGDPRAAWRDVESVADRACLVKLSDDDVALVHPGADPADIARALLGGERTELVVVTHGARGAVAYAAGLEVAEPAPSITVADTVGAGDSFMAALLVGLRELGALAAYGPGMDSVTGAGGQETLRRLLRAAVQASAITCSRPGADPPRRAELPARWPG